MISIIELRESVKQAIAAGRPRNAALIVLNTNRSDWDELLNPVCSDHPELNYAISELSELESELDSLTQNACMAAEYIGHRGTYGCGDSGHDKAFKAAEKKLKKVRKAIGYTYP